MLFETKIKSSSKHLNDFVTSENNSKKSVKKYQKFTKDDARIIKSGNVYRQLFESEVQLINALKKLKYFASQSTYKNKIVFHSNNLGNFPLIKALSDSNCDIEINKEVSILPENLLPTKTHSDLIVKLIESRKLKFNKEFEELNQSIGMINKSINISINDVCEKSFNEITFERNEIESHFKIFDTDSSKELSWELFRKIEIKIDEHFQNQTFFIDDFYVKLTNFEEKRVTLVQQQMSNFSTKLERIGHLAPTDVHRIMNIIIIETNESILRNREIYSDLRTKLMLSNIDNNRKRQISLKNNIVLWRKTISDSNFDNFKNTIQREESESINTIKGLLTDLDDIIMKLSSDIKENFNNIISNFNPEQYDSDYLNETNTRLFKITTDFDEYCEKFIKIAYQKVEQIYQEYLLAMNNIKVLLLKMNIFENEEECIKAVEGFCWPFLGSLQNIFEKYLNSLELIIEMTSSKLKSRFGKLYSHMSYLLNLWIEHQSSLNNIEEIVYNKLSMSCNSHQQQNLIAENDLNLIIDKMRQESNDYGLKESLSKCFNQLDKIKTSYTQFYTQQVQLVKRYPSLAEAEVKLFNEKLITYFSNDQEKTETKEEYDSDEIAHKSYLEIKDETLLLHFRPVDISNETFLFLKERIKFSYTEFIKSWFTTVAINTTKIYTTKVDELDSELKLRYHLHEPRYQRIEYDIHNVRSTELVIHAERVSRQCKAINNSLEKIKEEYLKLDSAQKVKQENFKNKLVADEITYMSMTNHYKLINIKIMLEERNNQYMNNLRLTLRTFRQNIESDLQNLRQSNATFVRSFKLFSVGGNFCPGEIDDFTKKIEKVNLKVEDMESEIMSNLEMVEKVHQDNLIILKEAFEEKFKYHIVDINFMETINRSMSNIQLKIKTEVSNSNSQSQFISEKIKLLENNLKNISENGTQQNDIIDHSVLNIILAIFGCINDRSLYLDCIKTQAFPKDKLNLANQKDRLSCNVKMQLSPLTLISKGGRQPNEDAGIKSVKTILKSQKEFLIKQNIESVNDSNKSEIQTNELENEISNKIGRTRSSSLNSEIATNRRSVSEKSKLVNKNQRLEKKYQVFGEDDLEECYTFKKKIQCYCREILDGILYAAELYYRNKGIRKVTQLSLQDNFDQEAEDIITKLKYYITQTKEYHDECLQEFNKQLKELEEVLCNFPTIVYKNILERTIFECNNEITVEKQLQAEVFSDLSVQRKNNYNELRPDLSQISKKIQLEELLSRQEFIYKEELSHIDTQFQSNRKIAFTASRKFCELLSNTTEQLLLLMDNLLTINDVYNSEPKPDVVATKELVRKLVTPLEEEVEKNDNITVSEKHTWIFNDLNDILEMDDRFKMEEKILNTKSLITSKYMNCHIRIINEREISVKKFKSFYFGILKEIEETKKKRIEESNNFKSSWDESVKMLLEINRF